MQLHYVFITKPHLPAAKKYFHVFCVIFGAVYSFVFKWINKLIDNHFFACYILGRL